MGKDRAIIVGAHVNGLGLLRALAARGVETAVIATKPYDIAHRSRYAASVASLYKIEDEPDSLLVLLEERRAEWAGAVVLPANDGALAALALHRERLSASYRVAAPPREVASYFLDKSLMLEAATAVGIDVPRCYGAAIAATAARSDLVYPLVVKPTSGDRFFARFGCKLFPARDRVELESAIARFAEAKLAGQVLELVPGADDAIYSYCTYLDERGEPRGGVTVRKLRQSPPSFGVARVAEIAPDDPEMREATLALVRRTGFRGIVAAEFKVDARSGRKRFMEINGRSVIYNSLLRRAGLDIAGLAYSEHATGRAEPSLASGWSGTWIHLHADLLHSLLDRRRHPVGFTEFLAPYRRRKVFAVWSARDPLPFFHEWARTARRAIPALARGDLRARLDDHAIVSSDDAGRTH